MTSLLRAQLHTAGKLFGVRVTVTDDSSWEVRPHEVCVGLNYYRSRGHSDHEGIAFAQLQLWQHLSTLTTDAIREQRWQLLGSHRPELQPLLAAITRNLAVGGVLAAFPGMRTALTAALTRELPNSLPELPRHLQWVALLLRAGIDEADTVHRWSSTGDEAVHLAWAELAAMGPPQQHPAQRVFARDPNRCALTRAERALALFLPHYESLLRLDRMGRSPGNGDGDADTAAADTDPGLTEAASPDTHRDNSDDERARAGDSRDTPEGADLFAAEQAGFVHSYLDTPLPAEGAALAAALEHTELAQSSDPEHPEAPLLTASDGERAARTTQSALHSYQQRVRRHSDEIAAIRELWANIVDEQHIAVRAMSRTATTAGEALHQGMLASAVIESRSGVTRPAAYTQRTLRMRQREHQHSTDYVLAIDRSASMRGRAAEAATDAAVILLEALSGVQRDMQRSAGMLGDTAACELRTALIVYDAQALVVKALSHAIDNRTRVTLVDAIRDSQGTTHEAAALAAAADQLGVRESTARRMTSVHTRKRVVILVTDGDTHNPAETAQQLRVLRHAGVAVYALCIGKDHTLSRFDGAARSIDTARELPEALRAIVARELV